jgi:ADP-ribose pyrophosphatase
MDFSTIKSEQIFQGKVFNVRVDEVQISPDQTMRVDVVEHVEAVVIVPMDHESCIWFVDQYRHAATRMLVELPAGILEPGEDPEKCAVRECREEIGMSPAHLTRLGGFYLSPGYSTEFVHLFLAQDLTAAPLTQDEDEMIRVKRVEIDKVREWLAKGLIVDAKTLAGLFLALHHLQILRWV